MLGTEFGKGDSYRDRARLGFRTGSEGEAEYVNNFFLFFMKNNIKNE